MNAVASPKGLIIGSAIGGGFFAGRFFIGAQAYGLIVSPKAEGDLEPMQWNRSLKAVRGALSYNDGRANTIAMAEAGSKLAKQILELRIGDCDDWHLMSRQEALMAFYELQEVPAFQPGGAEAFEGDWYWTSTQHAADGECAWFQYFDDGLQSYGRKSNNIRARAVRRIPI